jgi:beta-lactamase superfamily II metal-dependent hydrolase
MEVGALADRAVTAEGAITVEVLPARHGDCLLVSCPKPDGTWRLLVDTGPDETWPVLCNRLSEIPSDENGRRHIDLVIISHIDNDHIGATRFLFGDQTLGLTFGDVWFNGRHHLLDRGVREGEALSELLSASDRALPWNAAFKGSAVVTHRDRKFYEITPLSGYPRITLLSPSPERLAKLTPVWDAELEKLRRHESNTEEEREGVITQFPDLETLAKHESRQDASPTNGSSIAILLEHRGASVLLAADAFAADLGRALLGLAKRRGLSLPLRVDAFKLSHHGSRANLMTELLGAVEAKHYIISTNGRFGLPNDEALARVILYGGDAPTLWFNHTTELNLRWADKALQEKYRLGTRFPVNEARGVTLISYPTFGAGATVKGAAE